MLFVLASIIPRCTLFSHFSCLHAVLCAVPPPQVPWAPSFPSPSFLFLQYHPILLWEWISIQTVQWRSWCLMFTLTDSYVLFWCCLFLVWLYYVYLISCKKFKSIGRDYFSWWLKRLILIIDTWLSKDIGLPLWLSGRASAMNGGDLRIRPRFYQLSKTT